MCFVWIWEQTAIISLYIINWLVCITETECVYCAVRTECLNITQVRLRLHEDCLYFAVWIFSFYIIVSCSLKYTIQLYLKKLWQCIDSHFVYTPEDDPGVVLITMAVHNKAVRYTETWCCIDLVPWLWHILYWGMRLWRNCARSEEYERSRVFKVGIRYERDRSLIKRCKIWLEQPASPSYIRFCDFGVVWGWESGQGWWKCRRGGN